MNMKNKEQEKKKDCFIKLRIAKEEKQVVLERAESQGLNISEYIRQLTLKDAERVLSE